MHSPIILYSDPQDVINAKHEHKSLMEQASIASDLLEKCYQHLICRTGEITFDYLQAVAQCRNGLLIAGECLHESSHVEINASLLTAVKNLCTNKHINRINPTEAVGPNIFLLKVLAKSHNMSALKQVAKKHTWLLPPLLQFSEVCAVGTVFDGFKSLLYFRKSHNLIPLLHMVQITAWSVTVLLMLCMAEIRNTLKPHVMYVCIDKCASLSTPLPPSFKCT